MKLSTIALAFTPMFLLMFLTLTYAWAGKEVFDAAIVPAVIVAALGELVVWRALVRIDRNRTAEPADG